MRAANLSRRQMLRACTWAGLAVATRGALAQQGLPREMQIHKIARLGLVIWVENQPPWETELSDAIGHPTFVVQSPAHFHPPVVMTYASWPKERVADTALPVMAESAIQRASRNFGLNQAGAYAIVKRPSQHGVMKGFEAQFVGSVQDVPMDVRMFVGQASGHFPVALTIYTLEGKMEHLNEVVRRAWGKLNYLPG